MSNSGKKHGVWLGLALSAAVLGGCNKQDPEKLARVGRKVSERAEALTGGNTSRLAAGWQALCTDMDKMALDSRISARIRWDKGLEGAKIQVYYHDGQIELKGQVRNFDQRQRAVQLANSTVGAENVVDSLEVSPDGL